LRNLVVTKRLHNLVSIAAGVLFFAGCAGHSLLVPNPPVRQARTQPEIDSLSDTLVREDAAELDFSLAFDDTVDSADAAQSGAVDSLSGSRLAVIAVPATMARVRIGADFTKTLLYAPAAYAIRDGAARGRVSGRVGIQRTARGIRISSGRGSYQATLPCTLSALSAQTYIEIGNVSYRGSLICIARGSRGFALVNCLDVEQYLRGVVPLEIGPRPAREMEAIKAQAVAARTYTYRKIIERRQAFYDLVATVADQVYGGIDAENRLSDRAIADTRHVVLTHADTLIFAYYHSTCGGATANVEDVWDKPAHPYLRSRADSLGQSSCCSISRYFRWEEQWRQSELSALLARYAPQAFPQVSAYAGTLHDIRIKKRYDCGRIAECVVSSSSGKWRYGGDKIRFAFRRNGGGAPILRSSCFDIAEIAGGRIVLKGRGYGHGVGMCQMGAVGRARAGQSYDTILRAYYTDVTLARVRVR
jgi:stage II sporulation protein D